MESDRIISIHIIAVSGRIIQSHRVKNTLIGAELFNLIMESAGPTDLCIPKLLHKQNRVDMKTSLAAQDITDGTLLTLVWMHITKEQQQAVVRKMHMMGTLLHMSGTLLEGALEDDEVQILDTIMDLCWDGPVAKLILPSGLQTLTFGEFFNESLENTTLPSSLQSLTFGYWFNQSLDNTTLPSGLRNLTFSHWFNRSLDDTTLPSGLQMLTFGTEFNQRLDNVTLPSDLQNLTFGKYFNQSLDKTTLPSSLQNLTFGECFNQSLQNTTLPSSLQSLTLGRRYNKSLANVIRPSGLQLNLSRPYNVFR